MLPRVHAFEWNDQPWLPEVLRRAETDYLTTVIDLMQPFAALAPVLAGLVRRHGPHIVDLASGGAGPWRKLRAEIAAKGPAPIVTLTDLYPNLRAFEHVGMAYEAKAVDARAVPEHLTGIRTMFDAFHHLRPADAGAVLADAERANKPIVIAEATNRRFVIMLAALVLVPLLVLALTPLIRPWSGWRLVFTYLVPILPLLIVWDGVVSCLRTYSPAELRLLASGLDRFTWEAGELRKRGTVITYLIGRPRA